MTTSTAERPQPKAQRPAPANLADYLPQFYAELRRLARARLAAGGRYTLLDTTALVHESFLRLRRANHVPINDSQHFLAYATSTMRSVIVDYVRQRKAERRGGGAAHVTLKTGHGELTASDDEILSVHEALETLSKVDPRLVQVVEMRYFGGLTDVEIGEALGVTDRTVRRDWERARLLLAGLLGG
ncbi:MAG TPA: ECF-type sigma factor [Steroidobacteraceae bacterium]|nr:ECF-type sigma factor [Steroidobacteraceae bacterium]